jgi:DNA-binding LacI/PurR family transcriptional regulator
VDGIILVDRALDDKGIAKLQELGANFIVWGPPLPGHDYLCVGCTSVIGGVQATRHLVQLGRRKIGFIGGHANMVETYLRRQGYEQALLEAGLRLDEKLITYTDFSPSAGHAAMKRLLDIAPDLDAVFSCSDFVAVAAIEVLRESGRRVPDDVSIVGYDDIPLAGYWTPRLTTVRQPIREGGRLLVQKLLDLVEGRDVDSTIDCARQQPHLAFRSFEAGGAGCCG